MKYPHANLHKKDKKRPNAVIKDIKIKCSKKIWNMLNLRGRDSYGL